MSVCQLLTDSRWNEVLVTWPNVQRTNVLKFLPWWRHSFCLVLSYQAISKRPFYMFGWKKAKLTLLGHLLVLRKLLSHLNALVDVCVTIFLLDGFCFTVIWCKLVYVVAMSGIYLFFHWQHIPSWECVNQMNWERPRAKTGQINETPYPLHGH